MSKYLANYGVELEVDITPTSSPTWTVIGNGIDNISEALNEVVNQHQFLDRNGFGSSFVTGMQPIITLTGVRIIGDAAQDWIFSTKYNLLESRETNLRLRYIDNNDVTVTILYENVTMANLMEFGGASTDGSAISIEFHSNGEPSITNGTLLLPLTVVSVAGTTSGDTQIYVNPEIESGNIYRYRIGQNLTLPIYDQDVSSATYTTWDGSAEITATTGQEILIIEATSGNLARKAGIATITSM